MSSVATASTAAAPAPAAARAWARARRLPLRSDGTLALVLSIGLALVAFLAAGGVDLARNTSVEIVLTALAAALAGAVVLVGAPGRAWGGLTLLALGALVALTFASIAWSVDPATSWVEANRTLSYLAAFGTAMALARLAPARWRAVIGAVALATTALSAYALLVKVFPAAFDPTDLLGRLSAPFDYWNATGLMAAMGIPACVWAGARRDGARATRALTVPAIAVLLAAMLLSYSRSALVAAVIGVGCWFAFVPLRLRGALVLALGAAGGAAITLWAFGTQAITHDRIPLAARVDGGHAFGVVLVVVLASLSLAGLGAAFAMDRFSLAPELRRRIAVALVALVALVPLGGVAALAGSSRGLTGEVSHLWSTLTSPTSRISDNPGRLVEVANSRPRYWSQGLTVGEHALLAGVGAAGFGTARTRYTTDPYKALHAHSYVIETFADFGLIGLLVNLALLVAWSTAVVRTLGGRAMARLRVGDGESIGLLTMFTVVLAFGVQSLIDWTWFIPGTAVTALVCAGWLAGRGPPDQPVGRAARRRGLRDRPAASASLVGLAALTILAAWFIWQPQHSADEYGSAITALSRGDTRLALADARAAAASDPASLEPRWELAAIYDATGNTRSALTEMRTAVTVQPSNPASWQELGAFYLDHHQARAALSALQRAQRLDLSSKEIIQMISRAKIALVNGRR